MNNHPLLIPSSSARPSWRRAATPALPNRAIHVDLKGPKWPVPAFRQFLAQLARWGANGVLVEYEHRLPWLPLPSQFPSRDRYTRSELQGLLDLAHKLGLEWIPLVQTLGHVEYLNRLPGLNAWMENRSAANQLCPCRKDVRRYLERMIDWICELHPRSRFIHAGLDETQWLGHCPACRKRSRQLGGRIEFYLEHANWVAGMIVAHGKIPMMYGDIFLNSGRSDLLRRLHPNMIFQPWDYVSSSTVRESVGFRGNRPCRRLLQRDYSGLNQGRPLPPLPSRGGLAEDLMADERRRLGFSPKDGGLAPGFAQMNLLAREKRPIWGLGAVSFSANGVFHANFSLGASNCNQLIRSAIRNRAQGAVATCWARGHSFAPINSPWTLGLYTMAHFCASAWTGKTSPEELRKRGPAVARELGLHWEYDGWTLDDLLWMASNPSNVGSSGKVVTLERILGLLRAKPGKGVFAEGLDLMLDLEILFNRLVFMVDEARWWNPSARDLPPSIVGEMRQRWKGIEKTIRQIRPRARKYYLQWVGDAHSFDIWWKGLFDLDGELVKTALRTLDS
jgi:hypothetical protein